MAKVESFEQKADLKEAIELIGNKFFDMKGRHQYAIFSHLSNRILALMDMIERSRPENEEMTAFFCSCELQIKDDDTHDVVESEKMFRQKFLPVLNDLMLHTPKCKGLQHDINDAFIYLCTAGFSAVFTHMNLPKKHKSMHLAISQYLSVVSDINQDHLQPELQSLLNLYSFIKSASLSQEEMKTHMKELRKRMAETEAETHVKH